MSRLEVLRRSSVALLGLALLGLAGANIVLLAVITFQNTTIGDPTFVVSSSATVGAAFGGAAGF